MWRKMNPWEVNPRDLTRTLVFIGRALQRGDVSQVSLDDAAYWAGANIARLEGKKPPFKVGDKIRAKEGRSQEVREYSSAVKAVGHFPRGTWTIHRVYYGLAGDFGVQLQKKMGTEDDHIYETSNLELVPA